LLSGLKPLFIFIIKHKKAQSINKYCAFDLYPFYVCENKLTTCYLKEFYNPEAESRKLTQKLLRDTLILNYLGSSSTSAFGLKDTFSRAHFETFKTFNP
jgi:hypothetical protein